MEQAIRFNESCGKRVALLLMDIDHFKEINDTFGYEQGDLLLREIGVRLQGVFSAKDTVARIGEDEFAVLLPIAKSDDPAIFVDKIIKLLEPPFTIGKLPVMVEATIGISIYPDHGEIAESLMQKAQIALHEARRTGAPYQVYSTAYDTHSPARLALMWQLREAIEKGQLLLHYQPKISLKTGRITGLEALIRWRRQADQVLIPPDQFIPPAEQTGLICPLALFVIKEVCCQSVVWDKQGINIPIFANLSVRNLQDLSLPSRVAGLIAVSGMAPERLGIEITESTIMTDPPRVLEAIRRLKAIGIRWFAIDDFGTGYSSLSYIQKLPVDELKIDKSFVMGMTKNEGDAAIVRAAYELGNNLGLEVVAEGVENQETWDALTKIGCDTAQGYCMCKPLPPEEITKWLKESPYGLSE